MKATSLFRSLAVLVVAGFPAVAGAHPGHDDGHELTWDFGHLVEHPGATLLCLSVLAVTGWAAGRLLRRRSRQR